MVIDFETKKCMSYVANALCNQSFVKANLKNIVEWIIDEGQDYCNFRLLPEENEDDERVFFDKYKNSKKKAVAKIVEFGEKLRKKYRITERTQKSILENNLIYFKELFSLSEKEKEIVGLYIRLEDLEILIQILSDIKFKHRETNLADRAILLGIKENDVYEIMKKGGYLTSLGFFGLDYRGELAVKNNCLLRSFISNKFKNSTEIKDFILGKAIEANLKWSDFSHIEGKDVLEKILKSSLEKKEQGVNVLLYGLPGTGKTEFAKTLAQRCGAKLYGIGEGNDGDVENKNCSRYKQLVRTNVLLKKDSNSLLLVDEADDILGGNNWFFSKKDEEVSKIKVNRILEKNSQPTIWIANQICDMDKAYLRRFTFAIMFKKPDNKTIQGMWLNCLKENGLTQDENVAKEFSKKYSISPSFITMATKTSKSINGGIKEVELILDAIQGAYTNGKTIKLEKKDNNIEFNPKILNTDTDLRLLTNRIIELKRLDFSLCLYGVSGTGKSFFAEHLGEKLGIPVLKKKCSDLLNKYVGGTEENIAEAFEEARRKEALLIFDEADSFLQSRNNAFNSWEVTQVNEMLTQMEKHKYPFVCTTNLMDRIDKAALRRFTFKVKYDYMTDEQRGICFKHFFGIDGGEVLNELHFLTPGDFKVVKDKAEILGVLDDKNELIKMLKQEMANKNEIEVKKIGFI